jgi:hypothetical protein
MDLHLSPDLAKLVETIVAQFRRQHSQAMRDQIAAYVRQEATHD